MTQSGALTGVLKGRNYEHCVKLRQIKATQENPIIAYNIFRYEKTFMVNRKSIKMC